MKKNILSLFIISIALSLPVNASNTDDEIIKNLDFFQNMELMKDENPFASITLKRSTATEQTNIQIKDGTDKSDLNGEKKQ